MECLLRREACNIRRVWSVRVLEVQYILAVQRGLMSMRGCEPRCSSHRDTPRARHKHHSILGKVQPAAWTVLLEIGSMTAFIWESCSSENAGCCCLIAPIFGETSKLHLYLGARHHLLIWFVPLGSMERSAPVKICHENNLYFSTATV